MRRTRHVVLPVKSWQYMGLMVVSLACLTLGLVSRDRGGRSGSLAGPELKHTAPHEVDACPNLRFIGRMSSYDDLALKEGSYDNSSRAGVSISPTIPRDLNAGVTRSESLEPFLKGGSRLKGGKLSAEDRRSIVTSRRIRTIETSARRRLENSNRKTLMTPRFSEARKNLATTSGSRSEAFAHRSAATDRRARGSNRYVDPADRSIGPRLLELPENRIVRQRKTMVQNAVNNDERSRDRSEVHDVYFKRERLISQSQDRRSTERREDRLTRNRLEEKRFAEERIERSDGRTRSNSVRMSTVRSGNYRDTREDRSSRTSRSRANRYDRSIEDRRSERLQGPRMADDVQKRSNLVAKRSNINLTTQVRSSGTRSQTRMRELRGLNQRERSDRTVDRSMAREDNDIRKLRPEDFRRSDPLARLPDRKNSRDVNRVEAKTRMVWSGERKMAERTERNELQRRRLRMDLKIKPRDVRQSLPTRVIRSDVPRMDARLQERRSAVRSDSDQFERKERKISREERRLYPGEKLSDRASIQRSPERRQSNGMERRQKILLAGSEERRAAGRSVSGERSWKDSLRRNVRSVEYLRTSSSKSRDISRERRVSSRSESVGAQASRRNLRASEIANPEGRTGLAKGDAPRDRDQLPAERRIARELRTSKDIRERSAIEKLQTRARINSRINTLRQQIVRATRAAATEETERHYYAAGRRGRSVERDSGRNNRVSSEKHALSAIPELSRTSRIDAPQHFGPGISRITVPERHEHQVTRRTSQEREGRSTGRTVARELRRSVDKDVMSGIRERRATPQTESLQRNIRSLRTSRQTDVNGRLAIRDVSKERNGRLPERAIAQVHDRQGRKTMDREVRVSRSRNDREIRNERSRINFANIPDFPDVEETSNVKNGDCLRQALVLVLCAVYGASMFKGKGDFYSFTKIFAPPNRFVVW